MPTHPHRSISPAIKTSRTFFGLLTSESVTNTLKIRYSELNPLTLTLDTIQSGAEVADKAQRYAEHKTTWDACL